MEDGEVAGGRWLLSSKVENEIMKLCERTPGGHF
jgi:hypothetical protein